VLIFTHEASCRQDSTLHAVWSRVGPPPEIPVTGERKNVKIQIPQFPMQRIQRLLGRGMILQPVGGVQLLRQIQLSLGHASVRTTERNLGVEQNWIDAPCDRLGMRLAPGE
jgi:hypothetical protein